VGRGNSGSGFSFGLALLATPLTAHPRKSPVFIVKSSIVKSKIYINSSVVKDLPSYAIAPANAFAVGTEQLTFTVMYSSRTPRVTPPDVLVNIPQPPQHLERSSSSRYLSQPRAVHSRETG